MSAKVAPKDRWKKAAAQVKAANKNSGWSGVTTKLKEVGFGKGKTLSTTQRELLSLDKEEFRFRLRNRNWQRKLSGFITTVTALLMFYYSTRVVDVVEAAHASVAVQCVALAALLFSVRFDRQRCHDCTGVDGVGLLLPGRPTVAR